MEITKENYLAKLFINEAKSAIHRFVGGGVTVPVVAGSARISNITLFASKWVGDKSPYSQVVTVTGVTENSQVDLTPSAEQLAIFHNKDLAFVTENDGGKVTVYAVGQKPENDYTMQATVMEVVT